MLPPTRSPWAKDTRWRVRGTLEAPVGGACQGGGPRMGPMAPSFPTHAHTGSALTPFIPVFHTTGLGRDRARKISGVHPSRTHTPAHTPPPGAPHPVSSPDAQRGQVLGAVPPCAACWGALALPEGKWDAEAGRVTRDRQMTHLPQPQRPSGNSASAGKAKARSVWGEVSERYYDSGWEGVSQVTPSVKHGAKTSSVNARHLHFQCERRQFA